MPAKHVKLQIVGGPTIEVPWADRMTAQEVLEAAYEREHDSGKFTYALQFYGKSLGYLVNMINETYDSFISKSKPFFYWEFVVNGSPATTGIDNTPVPEGALVEFRFEPYDPEKPHQSQMKTKYESQAKSVENPQHTR